MAGTLLIYKQRHNPPNKELTAAKNQAHITYIGTRPGVMKYKDCDNGLFGVMNGEFHDRFGEDILPKAEVYALSKEKKTVFRSVISFTANQAEGLGLYTLEDWQRYVKAHISTIAAKNDIDIMNLEYVAAVHNKKNQPHVHIAFWDKSNCVQRQFVSKEKIRQLRGQLMRDTYPEHFKAYYAKKDITEKQLREDFTAVMSGYEAFLLGKPTDEYLLCHDEVKAEEKRRRECFTNADYSEKKPIFEELAREMLVIKRHLPKSGRLSYKFLPPETKEELSAFTEKLISSHEKFELAVGNFVASRLDLAEQYTCDEDQLHGDALKYRAQATTIIGNIILESMKNLKIESGFSVGNDSAFEGEESLQSMFQDILFLLSGQTERGRRVENDLAVNFGELGVVARNEYLKKLRDKGIGIER